MKRKFFIFHLDKNKVDPRVFRLEKEALSRNFEVIKIHTNNLILTDSKIFYHGNKLELSPTNIYWLIALPSIAHPLYYFFKNVNLTLYPCISQDVFDLDNKYNAHLLFNKLQIPTPKTALITKDPLSKIVSYCNGFPLVIKTTSGSGGKGVEIVHSLQDIKNFIDKNLTTYTVYSHNISFILQEHLSSEPGVDYRVLCVKDKVIGSIQRKSNSGFKSNLYLGGAAKKITLPNDVILMAKNIMEHTNLFMAGIDFIKKNDCYFAIEINTAPQFEGFEQVTATNIAKKILNEIL